MLVIIKKKWVIKYRIYKFSEKLNKICVKTGEIPQEFQYDAFVNYCAEDRFWVHSVLMKTLEETYGFKLCIHYRDFPLGDPIAETIIEKMTNSQYIIAVMSDLSLRSEWCQFELMESLRQIQYHGKKLLVIRLGPLEHVSENLTASHIMDLNVCLDWSDDNPKALPLFWAKLVDSLYGEDLRHCVCCCPGAKSLGYNQIYNRLDNSNN